MASEIPGLGMFLLPDYIVTVWFPGEEIGQKLRVERVARGVLVGEPIRTSQTPADPGPQYIGTGQTTYIVCRNIAQFECHGTTESLDYVPTDGEATEDGSRGSG